MLGGSFSSIPDNIIVTRDLKLLQQQVSLVLRRREREHTGAERLDGNAVQDRDVHAI